MPLISGYRPLSRQREGSVPQGRCSANDVGARTSPGYLRADSRCRSYQQGALSGLLVTVLSITILQAAEQGILDCKRVIRDNEARDKKRYKNMFA